MKRIGLAVAVLIGFAFFALPVVAALAEVDWGRVGDALRANATVEAARVSLVTATIAAVGSMIVGLPLAWVFARRAFPGRSIVRALVLMPIVLPPTVAAVALTAALAPDGLLGPTLDAIGVQRLPATTAALVVAQMFVAAPFFVLAAEAGFRRVDPKLEGAAATLGASGWFRFRTVALPLARRSILAGFLLAWVRALGEFGATLAFAGAVRGRTHTLPVRVWELISVDPNAALAIGIVMMAIAIVVIVASRRALFGTDR